MDNRSEGISELIQQAFQEHEKLSEYSKYAPIYNSRSMLKEIEDYLKKNRRISDSDEEKLNVGLLAAKALDFDDRFITYALLLHDVWNKFLIFLNKSRTIPQG